MPIKIQGNDYLQVTERLEMLVKEQKKDYSLITSYEVINGHILIFKADLKINEQHYTGHALGDIADGNPKTLEKTETCAIGRSLSSYGFHGGNFASADEMIDFHKQKESQPYQAKSNEPTDKQVALIKRKCQEMGEDFEQRMIGIDNKKLAGELIEELLALDEQRQVDAI